MLAPVTYLEEELGLRWLFQMRGPVAAPAEVVVIAMDRESSDALGYPNLPRKWSRKSHAQLVNSLHEQKLAAVGFDVHFWEPRETAEDQIFAEALRNNGRVILFKNLFAEQHSGMRLETLQPPIPLLANAALDTASFTLPKVPARINQAWLFKPGAGDAVSMPVVMLQVYLQPYLDAFLSLIDNAAGTHSLQLPGPIKQRPLPASPSQQAMALREVYRLPGMADAIAAELQQRPESAAKKACEIWHYTFTRGNSIHLNLYGPARSLITTPYHHLLRNQWLWPAEPRHTAAFIGFSEIRQPEQKDGFLTAFSGDHGIDISGVEIMATAFANLLQQNAIEPVASHWRMALLTAFGLFCGFALTYLSGIKALLFTVVVAAFWILSSLAIFTTQSIWLPLMTPLLIQLPLALVLSLLWHHRRSTRREHALAESFRRFLPPEVVEAIDPDRGNIHVPDGSVMQCTCLFVDMQGYTEFAEQRQAKATREAINLFFSLIHAPLEQSGGQITDMGGDSVLAVWKGSDAATRKRACGAALEIQRRLAPDYTTRLGLHCGEVFLGTIGSARHLEFRAVGDTVNTAKRLESANKPLATQILASAEVVAGLTGLPLRRLGQFLLKGKQTPVELYELRACTLPTPLAETRLLERFEDALNEFEKRRYTEAAQHFSDLAYDFKDQTSLFFARLCRRDAHDSDPHPDYPPLLREQDQPVLPIQD